MARYRTHFERIHFGYNPPLEQTADVVFDTEIPFDDDHLGEFEEVAWAAMREQNPHWRNSVGPVPGDGGWSSVGGGHKYECIG